MTDTQSLQERLLARRITEMCGDNDPLSWSIHLDESSDPLCIEAAAAVAKLEEEKAELKQKISDIRTRSIKRKADLIVAESRLAEYEKQPVLAKVMPANSCFPYSHIERVIDIGSIPVGTELIARPTTEGKEG